jgi:lipopolysaccharide export system permease protein
MTTRMALWMLFKIGLVFVVFTFIFGELVTPRTAPLAERLRLSAKGATLSAEFRSGMWTKDTVHAGGPKGPVTGSRFFNARQIRPDGQLVDVRLYEFDTSMRLRALITATGAVFGGDHTWRLQNVTETRFTNSQALPDSARTPPRSPRASCRRSTWSRRSRPRSWRCRARIRSACRPTNWPSTPATWPKTARRRSASRSLSGAS